MIDLTRRLAAAPILAIAACVAASAAPPATPPPAQPKTVAQVLPLVHAYCGSCHAAPSPDVLPKRSWPAVIRTMVQIAQERNGRAGISEQQLEDITALYYGSSPEELPRLPHDEPLPASRRFVARDLAAPSPLPFVTHVTVARLRDREPPGVLVSDGEARELRWLSRDGADGGAGRGWRERTIAPVDVPVRTQVVDLDADGDADILAADLGQLPPLEARVGKLLVLRQAADGSFRREVLRDGLGRVSDARAVDLDADGDLDIAVAVFGGGSVGELFWLENTREGADPYRKHQLLTLAGTIAIEPADLDRDGRLDLVALVAQEHEMVVAFLNRGGGAFERGDLARAPHPMYGSTSLTTADLDRDGDVDIVFTNGDAFDAQTDPKPYHGVQWLENKGGLAFQYHLIGRMYGASTAAVGDLDGDADLDVVVGSWVNFWDDPRRHAVVLYENDGRQNFTARGVAAGPPGVASIALADLEGDGAPEIVAGAIRMDLLLAQAGSPYRASRLFPPVAPGERLPRVVVFEGPRRPAK